MPSETVLDVIVTRAGWNKNRQRGPDNQIYRDFLTEEFLYSLVPLCKGVSVQAIETRPTQDVPRDRAPDLIRWLITELNRFGHPPRFVNLFYALGLVGNTIGFLRHPRVETHHGALLHDVWVEGVILRADFVLCSHVLAKTMLTLWGDAWTLGFRQSVGLSMNYRARAQFTRREGQFVCDYLTASRLISCEFTSHPMAGGIILGIRDAGARPRRPRTPARQLELVYET